MCGSSLLDLLLSSLITYLDLFAADYMYRVVLCKIRVKRVFCAIARNNYIYVGCFGQVMYSPARGSRIGGAKFSVPMYMIRGAQIWMYLYTKYYLRTYMHPIMDKS